MPSSCPKCGSIDFIDTVRLEKCNNCQYSFYYGDAHATGGAQISKELHPGDPTKALPKKVPKEEDYD